MGHVQINLFGSFHVERDGKSGAFPQRDAADAVSDSCAPTDGGSKDADAGHVAGGKLNQPRYGAQNAD